MTLTIQQARVILGISRQRVLQLLQAGQLQGEKVEHPRGSYWLVQAESVEARRKLREGG